MGGFAETLDWTSTLPVERECLLLYDQGAFLKDFGGERKAPVYSSTCQPDPCSNPEGGVFARSSLGQWSSLASQPLTWRRLKAWSRVQHFIRMQNSAVLGPFFSMLLPDPDTRRGLVHLFDQLNCRICQLPSYTLCSTAPMNRKIKMLVKILRIQLYRRNFPVCHEAPVRTGCTHLGAY